MLVVRLPEDIDRRLAALAKATGRSKSFYARRAIEEHLDDLEDTFLTERTLQRIRSGEEEVLSSEDFWRDLDD